MERQTKYLKHVVVASPEESKRVWNKSWEAYLKAVEEQGLNDPRRMPSHELMCRKCVL